MGRGRHELMAFGGTSPTGYDDPSHAHDHGQFSFRLRGVAVVTAAGRSMLVPPGRGIWIPAGVSHAVNCRGAAAYQAFYARPKDVSGLDAPCLIEVSPLLAALLDTLISRTVDEGRYDAMVDLMLAEVAHAPVVEDDTVLLMPGSPRLRETCERMCAMPEIHAGIDDWARSSGMSRRSFTRAFRRETGLSFGEWQHHARMARAISWLAEGLPAPDVAARLGYSSAASFRRAFGRALLPPSG